ncbi:hypothetical protein HMPREF3291_05285 [Bacillus sp. HMSC76G11]|nr:hypothetical protein HMPREF3291_05285 [Bacillus sp. HMSC76G11]
MFEQETANHSQEEVQDTAPLEQTEEIQDTQTDETPATTQEIPQAFKVKYNKEEIEVPYGEATDYIQKGLNYEKVQSKVSEYEQHLNRVAQVAGYSSHDELLQALDLAEQERQTQEQAQQMGIDEDTYRNYFAPVNDKVSQLENQLKEFQEKEIQRQIEADLSELQKNEDFPQHEQAMYEIATQYRMPLKEAFEFASLRALKGQIPGIQQQTEQKVMDQIRARQGKHVETSDNNASIGLDLSPQELEMAQKMGIKPEEYAKWK